jgi:hypothetical protein
MKQSTIILCLICTLFIGLLYLYFDPSPSYAVPRTCRNQVDETTSDLAAILAKLQNRRPVDLPDCGSFVEGTVPDKISEQIDMMNAMFSRYANRMSGGRLIMVPMSTERVTYFQSRNQRHQLIKYDTFFQEMTRLYTVRIHFEWIVETSKAQDMLTTDDKETIGYPCKNQWVPLPDQVITTARSGLESKQGPKQELIVYLNHAEIIHSSLVLGDLIKCREQVDEGVQPTSLETLPVKSDEYKPITGSCNYMNKTIEHVEATPSRSPLRYHENGLFTWDVDGTPVRWIAVDDDHIGVPTENPTVTGTPNGQTSFNWLFDLGRGEPNTVFT